MAFPRYPLIVLAALTLGFSPANCGDSDGDGDGDGDDATTTQVVEHSDLDEDLPPDSATTIGTEGGTAESHDGVVTITVPEGAVTEEITITILSFGRDEDSRDYDYLASDIYTVTYFIANDGEMTAPATVAIEMSESPDDRQARLMGFGNPEAAAGHFPNPQVDGNRIHAEVQNLDIIELYAVLYDSTDQCNDADPFGTPCSENDDCRVDGKAGFHCECGDELDTGSTNIHLCDETAGYCHSVAYTCGGIGQNDGGFCENQGGWTGGCQSED